LGNMAKDAKTEIKSDVEKGLAGKVIGAPKEVAPHENRVAMTPSR